MGLHEIEIGVTILRSLIISQIVENTSDRITQAVPSLDFWIGKSMSYSKCHCASDASLLLASGLGCHSP